MSPETTGRPQLPPAATNPAASCESATGGEDNRVDACTVGDPPVSPRQAMAAASAGLPVHPCSI